MQVRRLGAPHDAPPALEKHRSVLLQSALEEFESNKPKCGAGIVRKAAQRRHAPRRPWNLFSLGTGTGTRAGSSAMRPPDVTRDSAGASAESTPPGPGGGSQLFRLQRMGHCSRIPVLPGESATECAARFVPVGFAEAFQTAAAWALRACKELAVRRSPMRIATPTTCPTTSASCGCLRMRTGTCDNG